MIEEIREDIDQKVAAIARMNGSRDPALSDWASRIVSSARAVQGFEGQLIAWTIPAILSRAPHLTVVGQSGVYLPERALMRADHREQPPIHMQYTGEGRLRRLDQMVFHHLTGTLEFDECKRGLQPIGADHKRTRLRDDRALRMVGLSYAQERFRMVAATCTTRVISYYGRTGLPEDMTLRAGELDQHFGWPVRAAVEEHLRYFRARLDAVMPGLTDAAA